MSDINGLALKIIALFAPVMAVLLFAIYSLLKKNYDKLIGDVEELKDGQQKHEIRFTKIETQIGHA